MQAKSIHGNRDSRAHKVNTDASPINETELEHTFIHERQSTYYVTLRNVRANIVAV